MLEEDSDIDNDNDYISKMKEIVCVGQELVAIRKVRLRLASRARAQVDSSHM
jgi:hypothetical protein